MSKTISRVNRHLLGLDLGKKNDFTALVIAEQVYFYKPARDPRNDPTKLPTEYHIRHIERFKLGTAYTDIVKMVKSRMEARELKRPQLIIDHTGPGTVVFDEFREAGLDPVGINIHGGGKVTSEGGVCNVPKRDLANTIKILRENDRFQVAPSLPEAQTLINEMLTFRVKIDPETGHDSYEHWRENDKDDILLAAAVACWWGEKRGDEGQVFTFDYA